MNDFYRLKLATSMRNGGKSLAKAEFELLPGEKPQNKRVLQLAAIVDFSLIFFSLKVFHFCKRMQNGI